MEDYIFLIIAILLSIFGAINKNKKKKAAEMPAETTEEHSGNYLLDELFGDDFMEEKPTPEVKPAPAKQATPEPKIWKEPQIVRHAYSHQPFKSTLPARAKRQSISTTKKPAEEPIIEPDQPTLAGNFTEGFSLRKAVIYSTILERKYE
jgi:hypothetical protein